MNRKLVIFQQIVTPKRY